MNENVNEYTAHHQHHQVGGSNSLGIASLVLGLFALVFSLIPCVGIVGLPLSALGLLLGLIGCIVAITRNGHGIGFSIAGSVVCGLSLLAGLFWLSMIGAAATAINQVAKTNGATNQKMDSGNNKGNEPGKENEKKGDEPGKENEWIDATNFGARLDSIVVRVTSVHVDFVPLRKLGRETKSEEKLLQIHLSIENESDTKKIEYDSWGFSRDILNRHVPSLKDNFGNAHHRAHWEFAIEVEGQLRSASILPGKSIKDVLVFDLPVDKAQYLRLELPASAFGRTGMLRFQIPKKMIVGYTGGK